MSQVTNNSMSSADKVVAINWKITQGFNALGLSPSQQDAQLAVQLAEFVEAKDIESITVRQIGDEVSISFSIANADALDGNLAPFVESLKRCGYHLAHRALVNNQRGEEVLGITMARIAPASSIAHSTIPKPNMNTNTPKTENINAPQTVTSVGAALEEAGIVKNADGSIGVDPLAVPSREQLDTAEAHLDAAIAQLGNTRMHPAAGQRPYAHHAIQPDGRKVDVVPGYAQGRATGFQPESLVQATTNDAAAPIHPAAEPSEESITDFARRQREAARIAAAFTEGAQGRVKGLIARVDSKMSKPAKIGLGLVTVALMGAGLFYGGRRFGLFGGDATTTGSTEGGVVDGLVAALSK